jgi:hypothetical protein
MTETLNSKTPTNCSVTELKTVEQITNEFVATLKGKNSGANNYLKDFLHVTQSIIAIYGNHSFSFLDFVQHAVYLDLPTEELQVFFNSWVKILEEKGRLKKIFGVYDFPVFTFV